MLPLVTWTWGIQAPPARVFGISLLVNVKDYCLGFHFGSYVFNVLARWA